MARGACTFKQGDVTRALRATKAAGVEVSRIEIDRDGKIIMITGKPAEPPKANQTEWDEVLPDGPN